MNKEIYFSPDRISLGKDKWHFFLNSLKDELSVFLDSEIIETSMFWDGEHTSYASFDCSIDIVANIFPEANLQYGGVLCYARNYDEIAYVDAFLLAYINGKRVRSNNKEFKYLTINYDLKKGWNSPKWMNDIYGEWEPYVDMERWNTKANKS